MDKQVSLIVNLVVTITVHSWGEVCCLHELKSWLSKGVLSARTLEE